MVKSAGFRFYRSTSVKKAKYKAHPTISELKQGARIWLSLFSPNLWIVTLDEFEIILDGLPYSFWSTKE
jgi:hypothetical protein